LQNTKGVISQVLYTPIQTLGNHIAKLDKSILVIAYCAQRSRSKMATVKLKGLGSKFVDADGIGTFKTAIS
jgi:rhodanese-related sulfurtransferase